MDKIYEQAMLFDFYGELLTEHQRSIYQDAVYNDLSLGEIAGERGISRQGVHDLLRRCDRLLQGYEDKLHLVERFTKAKRTVEQIERLTYGIREPAEDGAGEAADSESAGGRAEEAASGESAGGRAEEAADSESAESGAGGSSGHGNAEGGFAEVDGRLRAIRKLSRELLEEL